MNNPKPKEPVVPVVEENNVQEDLLDIDQLLKQKEAYNHNLGHRCCYSDNPRYTVRVRFQIQERPYRRHVAGSQGQRQGDIYPFQ